MTEQVVQLFVYGTLMPGCPLHGQIEHFVRRASPGVIAGVLVDLGAFPALIEGPGLVRGVLLELDAEALTVTDRIEGYAPGRRCCFYDRIQTEVHLDDGTSVTAWTYRYANPSVLADHPRLVVGEVDGQPLHAWQPRH
jgi:gamma-glutamylcyclotransferase (GGCT)/AIG2-like uncharacterized protein YtfP